MRECYDDDNKKQKHGNLEISFKVCYRSDILSFFCEEKALSLQSCSALAGGLIKKLRFTHKQQENEARGERYKNVFPIQ